MTSKVFERREKKYLVGPERRAAVERVAQAHLVPDEFGRTLVTSVYLDTPDRAVIARSLEKPLYKEKLRLRVYGEAAGEALIRLCSEGLRAAEAVHGEELLAFPAFFELKKKFKGIVYKRRVRLSLPAAWAFVQGASYEAACNTYPLRESGEEAVSAASPALDRQIARELEAALQRREGLRPAAAIRCRRTAWVPPVGQDGPRVTFDDDLRYLDLTAARPRFYRIIAAEEAVMEVKAAAAMPGWLIEALSTSRTYPRSFSKYGEAARLMQKGA